LWPLHKTVLLLPNIIPLTSYFFLLCLRLHSASAHAASAAIPTYLPVPSREVGPPIPTELGYRIQAFGDGTYMVTDGRYQALFSVTDCSSVIVVDAPPTIGANLLHDIGTITSFPVTHMTYSHSHADHILAAGLIAASNPNISIIAHALTAEQLALAPDPHRPAPTTTFETSYTLTISNQTLELAYHGPNHEPGYIFIHSPHHRILMLVDVVFPGWLPFARLAEDQSVPGYILAHEQILEYDFTTFVGGHLNRVGTREDVRIQQRYVQDLYNTSVHAIGLSAEASGPLSIGKMLPPVAEANPGNSWALFRVYLGAVVEFVAEDVGTRWNDRLAGADVFGVSNAAAMVEAVRNDWGVLGPFGTAE